MSVQELFDFQQGILLDWARHPRAWLLQANPVWGSSETTNKIAIFDTAAQAEAYVEASKLPIVDDPEKHTKDGYHRTFRPDSFLWDYNLRSYGPMVTPALPWLRYDDVIRNPSAPSGPIIGGPREWSPRGIPEVPEIQTTHPQYGKDYDQGFGGSRTNMDGVVPRAAPLQKPE